MIFLHDKVEQELAWSFRCKGCGEIYVVRPVAGAETAYPDSEAIHCHKTAEVYSYSSQEMEELWIQ
jgi:hypothetical protein